jgi:5-methylcytosine-specific restriction endonuclease McrA
MSDQRGTRAWRAHSLAHINASEVCAYCGLRPPTSTDHIMPISKGGSMWDCANHAPACQKCNSSKKNKVWSTQPNSARTTIETKEIANEERSISFRGQREEQAG